MYKFNISMDNFNFKNKILNFLYKYLFILKAAAHGYIIRYTGNNQFEFYLPKSAKKLSTSAFIQLMQPLNL
jgi:hypothetical protein